MQDKQRSRFFMTTDTWILILLVLVRVILQTFTNGAYGFHRDEFGTLDAARDLAWGYVAYPPFTPFVARIALTLFGPSLIGFRFFSVLAQGCIMLLAGLIVRELGGGRWAQVLATLAVGFSPTSMVTATLLEYVTFDGLWWVLIAYFVIRLLKSEDRRWWLGIGAVIGLGVLTKYTIAFYAAGIIVGLLLTPVRRHLSSPWLWVGVGLACLIALPNLIWQAQHQWISLQFLQSIHARDVLEGRTDGFWLDQLMFNLPDPILMLFVLGGLYYYLLSSAGRRYQMIGWMYITTLAVLVLVRGRGYYLAPVYPMLCAGGAFWWEQVMAGLSAERKRVWRTITSVVLGFGMVIVTAVTLPVAPPGSHWWNIISGLNGDLKEEIGWPEFVQTVAKIYDGLPANDKATTAILVGNSGEAGSINLYGPAYGLPKAISGFNSYWANGYGSTPPQTIIVIGFPSGFLDNFEHCELAGHTTNSYNIPNEETVEHPNLYVCHALKEPWSVLWSHFQIFG
jgi:Dolichyl-phosphate-mannose-protein mannosyltransferase